MGNDLFKQQLYLVDRIPTHPMSSRDIEYLVFGVGSVRGIALVHAYFELIKRFPDLHLKGVAGISAGALMCVLVWLKLREEEVKELTNEKLLRDLIRGLELKKSCGKWSILSMEPLREMVGKAMTSRNVPLSFTFADLTDLDLRVFAVDIKENKLIEFSQRLTPSASVLESVLASCSMPLVFPPIPYAAGCLVDGAVIEQFPFRAFPTEHTLGFYLYDKYRNNKEEQFFQNLTEQEKDHIISIDVSKVGSLEMNPTSAQRNWLKEQAKRALQTYFTTSS